MLKRLWTQSVIFVLLDIGDIPVQLSGIWITDFSFREQTLYPQLCYLVYWLNSISPSNTFVKNFKHLLREHPTVNTKLMGFPAVWENEPLWR